MPLKRGHYHNLARFKILKQRQLLVKKQAIGAAFYIVNHILLEPSITLTTG
ncbi:hypothetical protein N644_2174 [Lactiplantibacillus paraplantarum]|nr:hypothetical protein N644_2174 [Lactiplantibacillus paraplantarum]